MNISLVRANTARSVVVFLWLGVPAIAMTDLILGRIVPVSVKLATIARELETVSGEMVKVSVEAAGRSDQVRDSVESAAKGIRDALAAAEQMSATVS